MSPPPPLPPRSLCGRVPWKIGLLCLVLASSPGCSADKVTRPSGEELPSLSLDVTSQSWSTYQCIHGAEAYWSDTSRGYCYYGLTSYTVIAEPGWYHLGLPFWWKPAQTEPITITFGQPVYNVRVSAYDEINCAFLGSVDFAGPTHSGVAPLTPLFSDSCDSNPQGAARQAWTSIFARVGGVTELTLHPMDPIVWVYNDPNNWNLPATANGHAQWSVSWDEVPSVEWGPLTNDCVTGDSILDLQATRDLLKALWDSSRADLPPIQRREFKGGVFQDWGTGEFIHQVFPPTDQGPCHVSAVPQGPLPGKFILGAHVHPAAPGDLLPCDPSRPSRLSQYDASTYGGPSEEDFLTAAEEVGNGGLAHVIMDATSIYHVRPGANTTNFASTVVAHSRVVPGQCTRP